VADAVDSQTARWVYYAGIGAVLFVLLTFAGSDMTERIEDGLTEGATIDVRLTGYWPFQEGLSPEERLMEGGHNDSHGNPLYTLEDFQEGRAPYVSVSGDSAAWPYGQRIEISAWPGVIFRVVDTGNHFRGVPIFSDFESYTKGKFYRVAGREPLDICVASSRTVVPKEGTTATIIAGDDLRPTRDGYTKTPEQVNYDRFFGQDIT
jgi:hypothetical protein